MNFSKFSPFTAANNYEKHIGSKHYCIAYHDDKTSFFSKSRYYKFRIGDIEGLLQKLDVFCFTYQQVDCLYTIFKFWFK